MVTVNDETFLETTITEWLLVNNASPRARTPRSCCKWSAAQVEHAPRRREPFSFRSCFARLVQKVSTKVPHYGHINMFMNGWLGWPSLWRETARSGDSLNPGLAQQLAGLSLTVTANSQLTMWTSATDSLCLTSAHTSRLVRLEL
ncbi:hypothetical protein LSH36_721g00003 [Paralvinella palmiformis]|uniref:Uncharacterized protein n=1 Tax=Paralvinella palmiformis TaxID=53620 RepID=A0AAD9MUS4_9ANNE|nr:hypothetical protein LSH36_721g00003 [Paralvinella palmiformis]